MEVRARTQHHDWTPKSQPQLGTVQEPRVQLPHKHAVQAQTTHSLTVHRQRERATHYDGITVQEGHGTHTI